MTSPVGVIATILQRLNQAIEAVVTAPATLVQTVEGVIALVVAPLPGNPSDLRALAEAFITAAGDSSTIGKDLASRISGQLTGEWQGSTGATASEVVADTGSQIVELQPGFVATAAAIKAYADTLSQLEARRSILAQKLRSLLSNLPKSGSSLLDYVGELYPWAQWAEQVATLIEGLVTVYSELEEAVSTLAGKFGAMTEDEAITTVTLRAYDGIGGALQYIRDGSNQSLMACVGVGIGGSFTLTGGPADTEDSGLWLVRGGVKLGPYASVEGQEMLHDDGSALVQATASAKIPGTPAGFKVGTQFPIDPDGNVGPMTDIPVQDRYSWQSEVSVSRCNVFALGPVNDNKDFGLSNPNDPNWGDSSVLTRLAPPAVTPAPLPPVPPADAPAPAPAATVPGPPPVDTSSASPASSLPPPATIMGGAQNAGGTTNPNGPIDVSGQQGAPGTPAGPPPATTITGAQNAGGTTNPNGPADVSGQQGAPGTPSGPPPAGTAAPPAAAPPPLPGDTAMQAPPDTAAPAPVPPSDTATAPPVVTTPAPAVPTPAAPPRATTPAPPTDTATPAPPSAATAAPTPESAADTSNTAAAPEPSPIDTSAAVASRDTPPAPPTDTSVPAAGTPSATPAPAPDSAQRLSLAPVTSAPFPAQQGAQDQTDGDEGWAAFLDGVRRREVLSRSGVIDQPAR